MARVTNPFERQHLTNLAKYGKMIDVIFRNATKEAAAIASIIPNYNPDKMFSFADYPITSERISNLLAELAGSTQLAIVNGINAEWTLANNKNNELARRVFGDNIGNLSQAQYRQYFSTNNNAREAFLQRKENGLNLSDRVWRYTDAFKNDIEMGIDLGLRNGLSADEMSRDLRQYLVHPDMLFRRVRDEHGDLVLSQRAADFHPGTGVYRSSYKNAKRMAVTETNMAYRASDYERTKQLDFVVGYEIGLSNNHTLNEKPFHDICDVLAGRYPRWFKFTGWHPFCRCNVKTILKTEEEIMRDNEAIMRGEEPTSESINSVDDVPPQFKDWLEENQDRIENARNLPYFLRDNGELTEEGYMLNGTNE